MYPVKQSTALNVPVFAHDVNGDGVTGITDGQWTKRISKDGAAFGAMTVTITEMENGWYSLPLGSVHTDTLGILTVSLAAAAAKRINLQFRVSAQLIDDLSSRLPAALVGGRIDADMGAISQDAVAADNLETMLDGTGGQVLSLRQLAITATGNDSAIVAQGAGSGHGIRAVGGATNGDGISAAGGASNGRGVAAAGAGSGPGLLATGGASGHGLSAVGQGAGHGINGAGGASSGDGLRATGGSGGAGVTAQGSGVGSGIDAKSGTSSGAIGVYAVSTATLGASAGFFAQGSTNGGNGFEALGQGVGHGIRATGGSSNGDGISAAGGASNGRGIAALGAGSGSGLDGVGGATGAGIRGFGGANGHGILAFGQGTADGLRADGGASGVDMRLVDAAISVAARLDATISSRATVAAVWDELLSVARTAGSFGQALKVAAYEGAVHFDDAVVNANTVLGVDGVPSNPVSTTAAVQTLLTSTNLKRVHVIRGTLTLTATLTRTAIIGVGGALLTAIGFNGQTIGRCLFRNLIISAGTATCNAPLTFEDCDLQASVTLTSGAGNQYRGCTFRGNGATLTDPHPELWNCSFGIFFGSQQIVSVTTGTLMHNVRGQFELQASGHLWSFIHATDNAQITLHSSINAGTVTILGSATVIDNTTGAAVVNNLTGRPTFLDAAVSSRASGSALAVVQADTDDIQARLPAALVSGRMDCDVQAWRGASPNNLTSGRVNAQVAGMATDVVTAAALAADAVTEIQAGLASAAAVAALNDLSTADIDARLAAIGLDHLLASAVVGTDVADDSILSRLVSTSSPADWDDFDHLSQSLRAISERVNQIGVAGAAINKAAESVVVTTGTVVSGALASTVNADGVYHQVADTAGVMDVEYGFNLGPEGVPTSCTIVGRINGANDNLSAQAWNWIDSVWDTVGAYLGQGGTVDVTRVYTLLVRHVGTGLDAGTVRIRLVGSTLTTATLFLDQIFVSHANIQSGLATTAQLVATEAAVVQRVNDVLRSDSSTLPGQTAPPLAPTIEDALMWLYKAFRNRKEQTATEWRLLADDELTVDAKAAVADDGTTASKSEIQAGP